jgi:hypothetical protein
MDGAAGREESPQMICRPLRLHDPAKATLRERRRAAARLLAATLTILAAVSGCGGSSDADPPPGRDFLFQGAQWPVSERFVVRIADAQAIETARAELRLPLSERLLHPSGRLVAGSAGHNGPWSWHLRDVQMVRISIELCDGRPSMVEANLNHWLDRVGSFCPWSARVVAEL